jgi:hypothetical protein
MDTKERLGAKNTHIGGNRAVNRIKQVNDEVPGEKGMTVIIDDASLDDI